MSFAADLTCHMAKVHVKQGTSPPDLIHDSDIIEFLETHSAELGIFSDPNLLHADQVSPETLPSVLDFSPAGDSAQMGYHERPDTDSDETYYNGRGSKRVAKSMTARSVSPQPKIFQCRGYGSCRMVFLQAEDLARHVR